MSNPVPIPSTSPVVQPSSGILSTTPSITSQTGSGSLASAASSELSLLPGVNVLVEGPTGTGKTHSLGTIVDAAPALEVFALFSEPGLETLLGYWTDRGLPVPPNLHWHQLRAQEGGFDALVKGADDVLNFSQESLHKMQDPNRVKHNQYNTLLRSLANFTDQRTGLSFGSVDKWGPNRLVALDSLSGINPIAMSLVIGNKPVRSQAEWGIAQDQIEKLIRQLTNAKCHFVLLAHVEREVDQTFGGVKVTVSTLGRALAPKIPIMFSDVILSVREGSKFSWSTAYPMADLKARNLPIADQQKPDFAPILAKWASRGGRFSEKVKE